MFNYIVTGRSIPPPLHNTPDAISLIIVGMPGTMASLGQSKLM